MTRQDHKECSGGMSAACRREDCTTLTTVNQEKSEPPREAPQIGSREDGAQAPATGGLVAGGAVDSLVLSDGAALLKDHIPPAPAMRPSARISISSLRGRLLMPWAGVFTFICFAWAVYRDTRNGRVC